MLPSGALINAQVIYKKRSKRHHVIGKGLLSQLAESIADASVIPVRSYVNRFGFIFQHCFQFVICILGGTGDKNIRSYCGMNRKHLL